MSIRGFLAGSISMASLWCGINYKYKALMKEQPRIDIEYQEPISSYNKNPDKFVNELFRFGAPKRSPDSSLYKNHALCYDQEKKIPHWVLELLSKDNFKGTGNRQNSNFKSDPTFSSKFVAQNEDYLKSGWSRGHMAAAGNHKHDQDAINDTFYLSNIVPQDMQNNAGFWNRFEIYCRDLAKKFDRVWVISGPLFLPHYEEEKKFVKYQVIGKNDVSVPTHLYKVIVAEKGDKKVTGAFVVPNRPINKDRLLKEHQVPLDYVEAKSGFTFFPNLDAKSRSRDLCATENGDGCTLTPWDQFELYYIGRRMESAKNLNRLEKAWKEIVEKGIVPDAVAKEIYRKKKEEFLLKKNDSEVVSNSERGRG